MRLSTFVLEVQPYLFVFILPNLGPFLALRGYFWGWGQVQRFFETHLCRQSTLVLEVQPYPFVINLATFRASCIFLGPSGLILGSVSGS